MKNFRRLAVLATLATYFLIFAGGLVRVSGAGLGCPDWPKCFGRWIPPISLRQLPVDFDPVQFNFTLAWIEYINRLIGVAVGILIAAVAVLAVKNFRKVPRIVIPAVLAAILVAFQGWQGSRVVASELEPVIVSIHMGLAFIIVSLMIYLATNAYLMERPETEIDSNYPGKIKVWVGLLWVVLMIQVILGTQVRESFEIIAEKYPLLSQMEWIGKAGASAWYHSILGVLAAVASVFVSLLILAKSRWPSAIIWQCSWTVPGLALIQLVLGILLFATGLPQTMQVMHMWLAAILIGVILIMFAALAENRRAKA